MAEKATFFSGNWLTQGAPIALRRRLAPGLLMNLIADIIPYKSSMNKSKIRIKSNKFIFCFLQKSCTGTHCCLKNGRRWWFYHPSDAASPGLVVMSLYTAVSLGSSTANNTAIPQDHPDIEERHQRRQRAGRRQHPRSVGEISVVPGVAHQAGKVRLFFQ